MVKCCEQKDNISSFFILMMKSPLVIDSLLGHPLPMRTVLLNHSVHFFCLFGFFPPSCTCTKICCTLILCSLFNCPTTWCMPCPCFRNLMLVAMSVWIIMSHHLWDPTRLNWFVCRFATSCLPIVDTGVKSTKKA